MARRDIRWSAASESRQDGAFGDGKAAQQLPGGHHAASGALNLKGTDRSVAAVDRQAIVDDFARSARTAINVRPKQLYAFTVGFEPGARDWIECAHLAFDLRGARRPVDPRLGLVDLLGIGDAQVWLRLGWRRGFKPRRNRKGSEFGKF